MTTPTNGTLRDELLRSALATAAHGWHVFPCAPGAKRPGLDGSWRDLSTADAGQIREWWAHRPWNIGIDCGKSRLAVLDLDVPGHTRPAPGSNKTEPTGADALARLCARHGQPFPAPTFTVRTPSGGAHLYFIAPDAAIGNSASKLAPLVDVRATGGYVVAPGSRTTSGTYTVINPTRPAPLPNWIPGLLKDKIKIPHTERIAAAPPTPGSPHAYAEAALASECDTVATAVKGTRNDTLNRSAFNLGQLIAGGILTEEQVIVDLTSASLSAGLDPKEITATIRSGVKAGMRFPRHPRAAIRQPDPLVPGGPVPLPRR